jgi:hypothetical protein
VEYYTVFDYGGLALVTLLGFLLLRLVLRHRRIRATDQETGGGAGARLGGRPGAASPKN